MHGMQWRAAELDKPVREFEKICSRKLWSLVIIVSNSLHQFLYTKVSVAGDINPSDEGQYQFTV